MTIGGQLSAVYVLIVLVYVGKAILHCPHRARAFRGVCGSVHNPNCLFFFSSLHAASDSPYSTPFNKKDINMTVIVIYIIVFVFVFVVVRCLGWGRN